MTLSVAIVIASVAFVAGLWIGCILGLVHAGETAREVQRAAKWESR